MTAGTPGAAANGGVFFGPFTDPEPGAATPGQAPVLGGWVTPEVRTRVLELVQDLVGCENEGECPTCVSRVGKILAAIAAAAPAASDVPELAEEILKNSGDPCDWGPDDPGEGGTGEDFAVGYVRWLEARVSRLEAAAAPAVSITTGSTNSPAGQLAPVGSAPPEVAAAPAALGFAAWMEARGLNPDLSMVCSNFSPDDMRDAFKAGVMAQARQQLRDHRDLAAENIRLRGLVRGFAAEGAGDAAAAPAAPQDAGDAVPVEAPHVHVTMPDGAYLWLECFNDDPEADDGEVICQLDAGESWDELAAKVREHQAGHRCSPPPSLTPVEAVRLAVAEDWQPRVDNLRALLDQATTRLHDSHLPTEQAAANELRERGQLGAL